jgi:hypothetical protein
LELAYISTLTQYFKGAQAMRTRECVLKGKSGVEELERVGAFAVIANRKLYRNGRAQKFAVVNKRQSMLNRVYTNHDKAEDAVHVLSGRA